MMWIEKILVMCVVICCCSCSNVSDLSYGGIEFSGSWQKVGESAKQVDGRREEDIETKSLQIDSITARDPLNLTYDYGSHTLVLRGDKYLVYPEGKQGAAKLTCQTVDLESPIHSFHSCVLSLDAVEYEFNMPFSRSADTLHLNRRIDEFTTVYSCLVRVK